MLDYYAMYAEEDSKMQDLMEKNHFIHLFNTAHYPITMTVLPNAAPSEQMGMFEEENDGVSSQDAKLVLQFPVGGIVVRMYGRLIMSEVLLSKIKNQSKKMLDLWLQADFADRMEYEKRSAPADEENPDFSEFFESEEPE